MQIWGVLQKGLKTKNIILYYNGLTIIIHRRPFQMFATQRPMTLSWWAILSWSTKRHDDIIMLTRTVSFRQLFHYSRPFLVSSATRRWPSWSRKQTQITHKTLTGRTATVPTTTAIMKCRTTWYCKRTKSVEDRNGVSGVEAMYPDGSSDQYHPTGQWYVARKTECIVACVEEQEGQ